MNELDKLFLANSQKIKVCLNPLGMPTYILGIQFAVAPSEETLAPIEQLVQYGAKIEVFSTEVIKFLDLRGVMPTKNDVASALVSIYKGEGFEVCVESTQRTNQ